MNHSFRVLKQISVHQCGETEQTTAKTTKVQMMVDLFLVDQKHLWMIQNSKVSVRKISSLA